MSGRRQTKKEQPPGVQGQIPLCFLGSLPSLNFPPLGHPAEITGNYFQWCSVGRREVNEFFYLPAWRSADGGLLATLGVFQGDCTESCAFQLGTAEFLQPGLSSSGNTGSHWKTPTFRAGPRGKNEVSRSGKRLSMTGLLLCGIAER